MDDVMYAPFLSKLSKLSKGDRAVLKRSAGIMLTAADSRAMTVFYRCLPHNVPRWQEDKWFAVACLSCLWDADAAEGEPFAVAFGKLRFNGSVTDSTTKSVESMLETPWDADGYMLTKLTRLVRQVRQKTNKRPINFAELLVDLIGWNSNNQYVQRKWARAIFAANYNNNEEKETN